MKGKSLPAKLAMAISLLCFLFGCMFLALPNSLQKEVYAETHNHSFSEEWTVNSTGHWHECTAGGCDIVDYSTCGLEGAAYGIHTGLTDDNTCDICGTVFYRPYGVSYTDSTITLKVNVLNAESEPYTKQNCVRFDAFLRANNSGTNYDANMNFDKNGYYNGTEFAIRETASAGGYCVKNGATYTVVLNTASLDQITGFDENNPYVWLILRPCHAGNGMDYGFSSVNTTYANFYDCSVCLGKFNSLEDWKNVNPAEGKHIHTITHGEVTDEITFISWDGGAEHNLLPTTAGNYVLTCDVTLTSTWTVPEGTTNLCLNGNVINANGGNFSAITIPTGATLNLYDCDTTTSHNGYVDENGLWHLGTGEGTAKTITGGIITGGDATDGGGVFVAENGTFNMFGGTISGNKAKNCGGGVNVQGTFNMQDGVIEHNSANPNTRDQYFGGGGVAIYGNGRGTFSGGQIQYNSSAVRGGGILILQANKSGLQSVSLVGVSITNNTAVTGGGVYFDNGFVTVKFGGNTDIKNNLSNGTKNNFHFDRGTKTELATGTDSPNKMNIGVTLLNNGTGAFTTNGTTGDEKYFFADDPTKHIEFDNNVLNVAEGAPTPPTPTPGAGIYLNTTVGVVAGGVAVALLLALTTLTVVDRRKR